MPDSEGRRVALITGASGGIGEAFAYEIAADGYGLVLVARNQKELKRVGAIATTRANVPVATIVKDVSEPETGAWLEEELGRRNLDPDVVVNNAGFGLLGPALELDPVQQLNMIDLNVRALTDLTLRHTPRMVERRSGGVINLASLAGYMPGPNMAVYYATKAFVLSFSEALSTELSGSGVTVTAVCPGPVPTSFQERAGMDKLRAYRASIKVSAEEVARLGWTGFKQGRRTVVPGVSTFVAAQAGRLLPRSIVLPLVKMMQRRE